MSRYVSHDGTPRETGERKEEHEHMKAEDLTGKKFGRLTVVSRAKNIGCHVAWNCVCECGNHTVVRTYQLKHGLSKSCGCLSIDITKERCTIHGETKTRLYSIWRSIKKRCYDPKNPSYKYYGMKGIEVCDAWKTDYLTFREWAVTSGYREGLTIERKNNSLGYCPENCKWATYMEQENHKSNNHKVEYEGVSLNVSEWCRITGIPKTTFLRYIKKFGDEKAVEIAISKYAIKKVTA